MTTQKPLRTLRLQNGLTLDIFDRSNRYYGNFHRVRIEVCFRLSLEEELFAGEADPGASCRRARRVLGETLEETRVLERMGVAGQQRQAVRDELVEAFLSATLSYLGRSDYPRRLAARRLAAICSEPRERPRLVS